MRFSLYSLVLLFSTSLGAQTLKLSLPQAIDLALENNITLKNQYLSRIANKLDLQLAEDEFAVQYNAGAQSRYNSSYNEQRYDSVQNTLSTGASWRNQYGGEVSLSLNQNKYQAEQQADQYQNSIGLSYSQPLLKGAGKKAATANLTQARQQEILNQLSMRRNLSNLISRVIFSYRNLLLAQQSLKIVELSLARANEKASNNQALLAAGRISNSVLVESLTDQANQKLSFQRSQYQYERSKLDFLQLLRLDKQADARLELDADLTTVEPALNLVELLNLAFANRPDYQQAKIDLELAKLDLYQAKDQADWRLDLDMSYNKLVSGERFEHYSGLDQGDYQVALKLEIPIDDMSSDNRVYKAQISLYQSANQLKELERNIELDVAEQKKKIEMSWQELLLSEQYLTYTQLQLETEQEKVQSGLSSNFQLVSYQNQLVSAQRDYLSAKINYLNLLTELDNLVGQDITKWQVDLSRSQNANIKQIRDYKIAD
ncbi:TolC family protein [Catenovulum sp. SX2]|uniref:TolC family protein n=1 Tax=Catenovulum sp. SX2 TaxID=3398614 RepID=UPI003F831B74